MLFGSECSSVRVVCLEVVGRGFMFVVCGAFWICQVWCRMFVYSKWDSNLGFVL